MKERPILFSGEMVRAILDGRKTQTRRVIQKINPAYLDAHCSQQSSDMKKNIDAIVSGSLDAPLRCPYGVPGDRLWVKETHYPMGETGEVFYRATGGFSPYAEKDKAEGRDPLCWFGPWKPSIFMRRKYSRLTLEITGVRVERLREIGDFDAIAEGVSNWMPDPRCETPRDAYRVLWESINGKGSWKANPWVWVIEFKKLERE